MRSLSSYWCRTVCGCEKKQTVTPLTPFEWYRQAGTALHCVFLLGRFLMIQSFLYYSLVGVRMAEGSYHIHWRWWLLPGCRVLLCGRRFARLLFPYRVHADLSCPWPSLMLYLHCWCVYRMPQATYSSFDSVLEWKQTGLVTQFITQQFHLSIYRPSFDCEWYFIGVSTVQLYSKSKNRRWEWFSIRTKRPITWWHLVLRG